MGLTDSSELIDEHWNNEKLNNEEIENEEQEEGEEKEELNELQLPDELISSNMASYNNRLNKTQQANLEKENKLNEDEIIEEKMWIDAIAAEPKSSHLRNQLANHYFSQNRLREAEFAYKAAINLDRSNSIAHYDYAFMRHHQFYWSLAKNESSYYTYAQGSKLHYERVLLLEENDIETHYQLSLLYLTMLETTLIESIDNIQSPLSYNDTKLCKDRRGIYSKWYCDRNEIYELCHRHLEITMNLCQEIDPVLFGTYITFARLLYIECTPNPFIYFKLSQDEIINKLNIGIKYLNYALEINETDATLHHDLALLLSHEFINKYDKAIYHWLIAYKLDSNNSIYTQQIGYIYQYKLININKAIKYYNISLKINENQSQIWNNLGILSAQNAKKQNDIIYATKCWRKCLTICVNHCEAHRNLGNIQWLHYYDKNKGEIHLQRAISVAKQVLLVLLDNDNNKYYKMLCNKFQTFLAQCKSDYGGLLLMMFKYNNEAEKELLDAINYDSQCISAHYYLGKYLYEYKKDYNQSIIHLNKYITMELKNKNICNKAHSHQMLGEIYMNSIYKNYKQSQYHFSQAIKLSNDKLPKWTLCKIHCGFADSIIKYLLKNNITPNIITKIRNKYGNNDNEKLQQIIQSIEIAKKHYRLILKLDNKYVNAPLGLAIIFGKIEGKIKLADRYYNDSIKICKEKLIKLYKQYKNENNNENNNDKNTEEKEEKKEEKREPKFSTEFKLNMFEVNNILLNEDEYDKPIINIIKNIKECIEYCIEAHLGKIDLIIISCHNNKFKEALSHCAKVIYLDNSNILAHCKKSLLYYKLNQKHKAIENAKYALKLAKEYDIKYKGNQKEKIVKNNLHIVLKEVNDIND